MRTHRAISKRTPLDSRVIVDICIDEPAAVSLQQVLVRSLLQQSLNDLLVQNNVTPPRLAVFKLGLPRTHDLCPLPFIVDSHL